MKKATERDREMKHIKCIGLLLSVSVMLTACGQKTDVVELTEEEKEHNAVIAWFENDITDEDEFTDLTDYQYYARTIGLEKNDLLSPEMWEVYYSESININKEIDGTAIYLIRLNPDKLLEIWAENSSMTADGICAELGTNRDEFYYNFGYSANSVGYAKNHKENKVSYSETEECIFGADNGENRQTVFSTHFLKVNIAGRYGVTYAGTDENFDIKQRDLLKSITKPKTYNYSDYSPQEYSPAFVTNGVGIKRILPLLLPNGWANAADTDVTLMFNMSPFSYGCTDEDRIDIFAEETPENTDVPAEHIEETEGVTE